LRHKGDIARLRHGVGEGGVDSVPRHDKPYGVVAQNAHAIGSSRIQHGLFERTPRFFAHLAQSGRDHDGRARALRAQGGDQTRNRGRRRAKHGQIRRGGQILHRRIAMHAGDGFVAGVYRINGAAEVALQQIAHDQMSDRQRTIRRAHHYDAPGPHQRLEVAYAHGPSNPFRFAFSTLAHL